MFKQIVDRAAGNVIVLFKQSHPLISLFTVSFGKKNDDVPGILDDRMAAFNEYFPQGLWYKRCYKKEIIQFTLYHISGSLQCKLDNFDIPAVFICFGCFFIKRGISTVDLVFVAFLLTEPAQDLRHFHTAVRKMCHTYHRVIRYDLQQLFQFCFFNFFHSCSVAKNQSKCV